MRPKIALEEHFLMPGFEPYWMTTVGEVPAAARDALHGRLVDFSGARIEAMDAAGIERAVISLAGPGVQIEADSAVAIDGARRANDYLAEKIAPHPGRFSAFAHLAMQAPEAAADELERCVRDHKFLGALINGHTHGRYLDDRAYDVFWERAQALRVPIYIHPTDPVTPFAAVEGVRGLKRATWEWTLETGSHALRLVFSGVFDRYPDAVVILGHLGETLPYLLWRFDSRAKLYGVQLKRAPSDYIKQNIAVTLSGMFSREPLICALSALGADRVMFSADYPFESATDAAAFIDSVDLDEATRAAVCHGNAERLLGL